MKVIVLAVALCVACLALGAAALPNASLLDQPLPEPPRRHPAIAEIQHAAQPALIAVSSNAGVDAHMSALAQASLAVDDSLLASASAEDMTTIKGQMSADEQALIERQIPIPNSNTASEPAKPVEFTTPPTRDVLAKNLGPRGYPWPEKLQNALNTVSDAAKFRINQIKRQAKWASSAQKLVSELGGKKHKVLSHVDKLTKEIRDLLAKKKRIQNKQLQDKLVERLQITHANLKKLRRQTHNIRKHQADMLHHKEEISHALEGIKRSLATLKGLKRKPKYPTRGAGRKLKDELSQFDPDLSFEAEADEVYQLSFPDATLAEVSSEADIDAEEQSVEEAADQE